MRMTVAVPLAIGILALSSCGDGPVANSTASSARTTDATSTTGSPSQKPSTATVDLGPSTTQPPADPGTTATDPEPSVWGHWSLDPAFPVADTDTEVHVVVGPYGCSDELARTPLRPGVRVVEGEIRITIDTPAQPEGSGRPCINRTFPAAVELGMPIDGRPLVDATCLLTGSRAGPTSTELCVQRP